MSIVQLNCLRVLHKQHLMYTSITGLRTNHLGIVLTVKLFYSFDNNTFYSTSITSTFSNLDDALAK